jgi:hypothetical protein
MNGWEQIRFHVDDPTASSWLLLSFLPPLQFTPPTTRAYCYCALAELQSILADATPVASNCITGKTTATTTDNGGDFWNQNDLFLSQNDCESKRPFFDMASEIHRKFANLFQICRLRSNLKSPSRVCDSCSRL